MALLLAARLVGVTTRHRPGDGFLPSRPGLSTFVVRRSAEASPAAAGPVHPLQPTAAAANHDGLLCEIRWESDEDDSWFAAVTTEAGEHEMLAESSTFAWRGAGPPSRTKQARAALYTLIDQLEAAGWRPVRGYGRQHGDLRWYARRFLLPAGRRQPYNRKDDPTDRAVVDVA